jgi:hypothetical protein
VGWRTEQHLHRCQHGGGHRARADAGTTAASSSLGSSSEASEAARLSTVRLGATPCRRTGNSRVLLLLCAATPVPCPLPPTPPHTTSTAWYFLRAHCSPATTQSSHSAHIPCAITLTTWWLPSADNVYTGESSWKLPGSSPAHEHQLAVPPQLTGAHLVAATPEIGSQEGHKSYHDYYGGDNHGNAAAAAAADDDDDDEDDRGTADGHVADDFGSKHAVDSNVSAHVASRAAAAARAAAAVRAAEAAAAAAAARQAPSHQSSRINSMNSMLADLLEPGEPLPFDEQWEPASLESGC